MNLNPAFSECYCEGQPVCSGIARRMNGYARACWSLLCTFAAVNVADLLLLLPNSKAELPNNRYRRWRAGQKNRRRHAIDSICSGKSPATCMCAARGNNIYRAKGDTSLLRARWLYQSVFQVLFKSVEQGFQHIAMIQAQITHILYRYESYSSMLTIKLKDNRYFTQTLL